MSLNGITVENASLAVLKSQTIQYPDSRQYPFFAGCLSLGASGATNQSFSRDPGPLIASLPSGWMWEREWTPSNAFGMHIGSVEPAMPGSLWFGGYDQNRIVRPVLTLDGGPRDAVTLSDIGIDIIGNNSAFDFDSSKSELLAAGNSSIGSGLTVSIDGCSPYLTLPRSTCDNIAQYLPVNFDQDLGLYLWDTTSDKYERIVHSAAALRFPFMPRSNADAPLHIRVPFLHLNLTLTEPLVDRPTPYFPCHVNDRGQYVLGRALLQDAFVGANWHPDAGVWWLAQAPGRRIQSTTNIVSIGETDQAISEGGNDWEVSWRGVWDNGDDAVPPDTPPSTSSPPVLEEEPDEGLSTGAKAGIGVGIAAVVLAIGLGAFFFWRRRRNQRSQQQQEQPPSREVTRDKFPPPSPQELPPHERQQTPSPYLRAELAS